MKTFLEEVVSQIVSQHTVNDNLILVVPSKRAGLFLLQLFAKTAKKPSFAPTIYTIEEFVSELSGIRYATNTQLLFELYHVYRELNGQDAESFHDFSKWGGTLLQDFNEIDRYLIPQKQIFSYLSAIQETDHWYLQPEKTPLIEAYIKFWQSLEPLYNAFSEHLVKLKIGYQGLVYRKASNAIEDYSVRSGEAYHIFIGFNALNTAESTILQTLLFHNKADVYWDIDPVFLQDPVHDAGYFIRSYLKNWNQLAGKTLKGPVESYTSPKDIRIIGVPRSVSQAKYVGDLLDRLVSRGDSFQKSTAIVLGDENLLNPILNAIPPSISQLNITMGMPLAQTPVASLFNEFISLYVNRQKRGWYHKDLLSLVSHPYVKGLFHKPEETLERLNTMIRESNWIYIKTPQLNQINPAEEEVFTLLFSEGFSSPTSLLKGSVSLVSVLKDRFKSLGDTVGLEYLTKMETVFNEIGAYVQKYDFITDLKSFQSLFRELMSRETIDFYGKPLEGIQLMGMLESRNLDFETVIITSLNEGILPSGKTNASFIPFDLKKEFKMPTYKEKDAVYTYHFYRLLQRAKNIFLVYNTEPDVLEGGERSRFISQLLTENRKEGSIIHIIASPAMKLPAPDRETISKDASVLESLRERATKGFSPSALASYIRDPIVFYKKYVLGIKETEEVEENIAANTFGTIIHASLEQLFTPFLGEVLEPEKIKARLVHIPEIVANAFAEYYPNVSLDSGKNLIAFQVIQRYLEKYLKMEMKVSKDHRVELLAVEDSLKTPIEVPGLQFPIFLKGTIDRVDKIDGMLRILDYKTGLTKNTEVEIKNWEDIVTDPDKSKAFQMMTYALMYSHQHPSAVFQAGIVPFRSLDKELFLLGIADSSGGKSPKKEYVLNPETLNAFREQLQGLLQTLFDMNTPFQARVD